MLSSLTSGVTGLDSFQEQMDVIGNNIANLNTTGFKAGVVDFADAFSNTLQGAGTSTPALQVGTGVNIDSIGSNWNEGAITSTGVPSNLAISGNGFFQVVDPVTSAKYLTQDGTFSVNSAGYLVTSNGDYVQGYTGSTGSTLGNIQVTSDPADTSVSMVSYTIDAQGHINVAQSDGSTYVSGQVLLQNVQDPQMMTNEGNNLYSNWEAAGPNAALAAPGSGGLGSIQSGALEASNVDLSTEMANLISAQRAFEASSKMISTSNEVLETVVNMKQS